ncbi:MAG: polymerase [Treponema sp.]|nr:polymerase [Treponema sp.]
MGKFFTLWGFLLFFAIPAFSQEQIGISGMVEWDKMEIQATVSLNLASAGLSLPAGRTQGEALINSEYIRLIRPSILNLQMDSSSVIGDHLERGEGTLMEVEHLALQARSVPPALSTDLRSLSASYFLDLTGVAAAHIHHERPIEILRTLSPVPAPVYTGIIIIAYENLPVHGTRNSALPRPCLFPKIWDTDMNLIFERNMLNPRAGAMVRYFPQQSIFATGPSGLSPEIAAIVGNRPLRIHAYGIFGISPTDPIINRDDALLIISSEENRSLLREGKVAIILDNSVLREAIVPGY